MPGLEELRRVVRRCKHPFDEPAALEVPAAVREVGLLTDQEEDGTPLNGNQSLAQAMLWPRTETWG